MARTALDRAERLFAAGRHAEVVRILEPQVPVYRESPRFYFILGVACLRGGDLGGASAYLRRAEQLTPDDLDAALALAALDLRRGQSEKAIETYLRVLEERPRDRTARRGLDILKGGADPQRLAEIVRSGRIAQLYPGPGGASRRMRAILIVATAVAALGVLAIAAGPRLASAIGAGSKRRPEVEAIGLSAAERAAPITMGGSFRYILTEREALAAFERAKAFFQEYRDNAAMVEINRLLGSNASQSLKSKAASLKAFAGAPDFRTLRDAPDFASVARDPALYDGCAVAWKGMAANVRQEAGRAAFDFLVGYHDKSRLEGVALAFGAQGAVPLDRPLEILAKIRVESGKATLECVAIHEMLAGAAR